MSTSQTLDRGLAMLESIAWAAAPPTIDELAEVHGVHRSIAYRIVRTLEARRSCDTIHPGAVTPGSARVARLGVRAPLLTAAVPALTSLANELGMTSFLVVRDGDEAVTIESIEPQTSETTSRTVRGPPSGRARRAGAGPARRRSTGRRRARRRHPRPAPRLGRLGGEVVPGLASVAAPIDDGQAVRPVRSPSSISPRPSSTPTRSGAGSRPRHFRSPTPSTDRPG